MSPPDNLAVVRNWMTEFETKLRRMQRDATIGSGRVKDRPALLMRLQDAVLTALRSLITVFWTQTPNDRTALVPSYLATLATAKLVSDDVFVEALHAAGGDRAKVDVAKGRYRATLIEWIKGSPLLDPATNKNNDGFIPEIKNRLKAPGFRALGGKSAREVVLKGLGSGTFLQRLRDAVRGELAQMKTKDGFAAFGVATTHMLGLLLLRAQLELVLRSEVDVTNRSGVEDWYAAAEGAIDELRQEVLDVVALEARRAFLANDPVAAERLRGRQRGYLSSLGGQHSMRSFDASVLYTFFSRELTTGRFGAEDEVKGVNRVSEMIGAYVGQPNPDGLEEKKALSVDAVVARRSELTGQKVRAFGLFDRAKSELQSERTKTTLGVILGNPGDGAPYKGAKADRRALVEGKLTSVAGGLALADATIVPHANSYGARVGFPLLRGENPQELVPAWRHVGPGIAAELRLEGEAKSLPKTLAGQQRLQVELLRHEEVRKAFADKLAKSATKTLDLHNLATRAKVWEILFRKFSQAAPKTALKDLFALMEQYTTHFTRHTYFNVRDVDPNYIGSRWPTDLTGSEFYDCGVYAVRAAYDIYRAVHPASVKVEFRFLSFVNHVCLVGFAGGESFLVNNDLIYEPKAIVTGGGAVTDADRERAAFAWAQAAYATVYDVRFAVFPAVLPTLQVTTDGAEPAFRTGVWETYKKSLGWGVDNTAAPTYFEAIDTFDKGSLRLQRLVETIVAAKAATGSQEMAEATTLALALYDLSGELAKRQNFFVEKAFAATNPVVGVGFLSPPPPRKGQPRSLPMYDLVDLLKQRQGLTSAQQQLVKKRVRDDHMIELQAAFAGGATP